MKKGLHPKYYSNVLVSCACGNTFTTGSTLKAIQVDICSACHPYFTGKQKFIDTQGRVEKFIQKRESAKNYTKKRKTINDQKEYTPKTLKEMLAKK